MFKKDTIEINGIRFKFGKVEWEDAFSCHRWNQRELAAFVENKNFARRTTFGYYAQIDNFLVIISETTPENVEFDVTVVPLSPKVRVK